MRAKAASIFHRERDEDVGPSVDHNDRLRGDAACQELSVLNLLGSVARDGRGVREDRVTIYCSHYYIHNQVAAFRKEVQDYNVSWSRIGCNS